MQQITSDVGSNMYFKDHQKDRLNIHIGNVVMNVEIYGQPMDILGPTFSEQAFQYNVLPTPTSRGNAKKV